jgi:membrane associated rhomboid family serine protease
VQSPGRDAIIFKSNHRKDKVIVFPLSDDNPTRLTPYVTYGIMALNIAVFLHEITLLPQQLDVFFDAWAVVPAELTASFVGQVISPSAVPEWFTLLSSQFLHGGFLHIAGNLLFLWIFGNNIEDKLGHSKFLVFYLGCGVLAGLTQWFFSATSAIPSLGASGAIAGVLGAYIIRFPRATVLTLIPLGIIPWFTRIPAVFFLGIWFIQQALYSVASLGARSTIGMESGGVAYWAHAGGFVFGVILGPLLGLFDDRTDDPLS